MAEHYHDDYLSTGEGRPRRLGTNRWHAWVGRTRVERVNGLPEQIDHWQADTQATLARIRASVNRSKAQRERHRRERAEAEARALGETIETPQEG